TPNDFPARTPIDRTIERGWRTGARAEIQPRSATGRDTTNLHARNFLDCVKSRQRCNCDIETGHRSTSATLIANIAHRTHTYLQWDGKTERFTNSDAANRHLHYEYRAPYRLPV